MVERKCAHVGICERVISGVESMRQSVYSASLCGSHGCGLHSGGGEGGERDEKCVVVCMTLRQAAGAPYGRRNLGVKAGISPGRSADPRISVWAKKNEDIRVLFCSFTSKTCVEYTHYFPASLKSEAISRKGEAELYIS